LEYSGHKADDVPEVGVDDVQLILGNDTWLVELVGAFVINYVHESQLALGV